MRLLGFETPFLHLRGPFEELANIFIICALLQILRVLTGLLSTVAIEFCCRVGPANARDRKKIASNAWYALYYSGAVVAGTLLMYQTGWMQRDIVCNYEDAVHSLKEFPLVYIYQCTQVAFYLNYLFAMITGIDAVKKDQVAFFVHHVVTIALIIFSRNWGYMRVQLAILVLHDAADPLLHYAKLIKLARPNKNLIPDVLLALFALTFFVTRWGIFPAFLIDSCRDMWITSFPNDLSLITAEGVPAYGIFDTYFLINGYQLSFVGIALCLLYTLFALHLYWGFYILRIIWTKCIETKIPGDVTVNDEDPIKDIKVKKA